MLFSLFFVFCVISTPLLHDPLVLSRGYSTLWLSILYIVGAYIHKYNITAKFRKSIAIGLYLVMVIITFSSKIIMHSLGLALFEDVLVSYTSPTIVLSGIFLFILFAKFENIPVLQKIIRTLAPASLGVYLIHFHPLVWEHLLYGFSKSFVNYNCIVMLLLVLGASAVIYLACTLIELVRIRFFRLLKISHLCNKFDHYIMSKFMSADEAVNS